MILILSRKLIYSLEFIFPHIKNFFSLTNFNINSYFETEKYKIIKKEIIFF